MDGVRGVRWRANTLSHSHKWVTNWEPFGNVSGSFPKISFCRILGEDIYKMWEVLGERRVRWGANTLSPAAQGRGRVLAFFSNNGSQIGSFFGVFLEAFQDILERKSFPTLLVDRLAGVKWILGRQPTG